MDKSMGTKPCKFPFIANRKIGEVTEDKGCVKGKSGDWCATEVKPPGTPHGYPREWGYCNQDDK